MGIDGLLNLLRPLIQKQHISSFRDKRIGIDVMPWIYKGCYSCTYQLNQDIQSVNFLYYLLQMIDMLNFYNIQSIFVFDGKNLSLKRQTLEKRNKTKQENKNKGLECLKNNQLQQARKYLSRCIQIDQRIIALTMRCLKTKNIPFIVAPYQADTQLAKMKKLGLIDAVISQDSDLLVYGTNVLFKLNQNGQCDYVDLEKWSPNEFQNQFLKLYLQLSYQSRIDAVVLAGSDYNPSIKGIGIKRAIKLIHKQTTTSNVINLLKNQKVYSSKIPENYQQIVNQVKLIFTLATTYNPLTGKLQQLDPKLMQQTISEIISQQKIFQIVGQHFQYNQDTSKGLINVRTFQKRILDPLNFRQIFSISKQNLIMYEVLTKKKRQQQQKLRKQLAQQKIQQKQIQQVYEIDQDQKYKIKKKIKPQKIQLTQQQIQQRKTQRKNRIVKLQNMMNSTLDLFTNFDQDSNQSSRHSQTENSMQQGSLSMLEVLNPFLKKKQDKSQHIINKK